MEPAGEGQSLGQPHRRPFREAHRGAQDGSKGIPHKGREIGEEGDTSSPVPRYVQILTKSSDCAAWLTTANGMLAAVIPCMLLEATQWVFYNTRGFPEKHLAEYK